MSPLGQNVHAFFGENCQIVGWRPPLGLAQQLENLGSATVKCWTDGWNITEYLI